MADGGYITCLRTGTYKIVAKLYSGGTCWGYCNNNFTDDIAPIPLKRAPLALNVPTFINLYGYGYENIYELSGAYSIHDADIHWVSQPVYQ